MKKSRPKLALAKETVKDLSSCERAGGNPFVTLLQCTYLCTYGNGYGCSDYCPTSPVTTGATTCNQV
jgi:hypothetical protein